MGFFRRRRDPIPRAEIDASRRGARGFGYKAAWFAFRTDDDRAVVDALALRDRQPCEWTAGIERAYDDDAAIVGDVPPPRDDRD